MTARTYNDAQRVEAIDLAGRVGVAEAGRRLEINAGTIRQWRKRAIDAASAAAGVEIDRSLPWPQRVAALVPELGRSASAALEAARKAIDDGRARDARDFAVTLAVLVDKGALLAGHATSRSESASIVVHADEEATRAEIAELRRELGLAGHE